MANLNNQSLDDTLQELLDDENKTSKPEKNLTEKPKRGRKPKAKTSDKLPDSHSEEKTEEEKTEEEKTEEEKTEEETLDNSELDVPEIIMDTSEELQQNVELEESKNIEESKSTEENFEPEVVPYTSTDFQPDIETPKSEITPHKIKQSTDANNMFKEQSESHPDTSNNIIGTTKILTKLTPMYRAKNDIFRIRSYQGLIKFISKPEGEFIKVEYLRQGFGLCQSYAKLQDVIEETPEVDEF